VRGRGEWPDQKEGSGRLGIVQAAAGLGQTSCRLKIHYQEHIRYIRSNNPLSAYTQHILHNQQEYGTMHNLMALLKPLNNPNMLTPYEQFYIQTLHREGKLIPEQCPGDPNPLFELAIHPSHAPHDRVSCTISLIQDA